MDKSVKDNWEKLQTKYNYPVDALGRPIKPTDEKTLKIWKEEGIDRFMKK